MVNKIKDLNELIDLVEIKITDKYDGKLDQINNLIDGIAKGNIENKLTLKRQINLILKSLIKEDEINKLIKQYHVNYFEKIYTGKNKMFDSIINSIVINEDDDMEKRLDILTQIIFQEKYGFSILDPYFYGNIKNLNEISIDRKDYVLFQFSGVKEFIPKLYFNTENKFRDVVQKSISFDRTSDLNPDKPEVLCQRINGERVTVTIPPYSKYYSLNVRYFNSQLISTDKLIELGTTNKEVEELIEIILPGRPNIVVIGDQGSGKTTYLLRLIGSINDKLSILTIESMFELNIDKYYPQKSVQALKFLANKNANDAFQTGLRKNRDIMITGEVRSPEEADVTLQAMTRQSRGSMGTFHTTSPEDFIYDYKNLLMKNGTYTDEKAALYDISRAVDILIFTAIDRNSGKRYLKSITEIILDKENPTKPYKLNTLFKYDKLQGKMIFKNKVSKYFIENALEYEFTSENLKRLENLYKKLE